MMDDVKVYNGGKSDARKRQGGGIVPAPPGSRQTGKSDDGLPRSLTTSDLGERTIAEARAEGEDLPLRIRGGGGNKRKESKPLTDSEEDQIMGKPIKSLRQLNERDIEEISYIRSKEEHVYEENLADYAYRVIERLIELLTETNSTYEDNMSHAVIYANLLRQIIREREDRWEITLVKNTQPMEEKGTIIDPKLIEDKEKKDMNSQTMEVMTAEIGIQAKMGPIITQIGKVISSKEVGIQSMDTTIELEGNKRKQGIEREGIPNNIEGKIDEILKRISRLEERVQTQGETGAQVRIQQEEDESKQENSWSTVVKRRNIKKKETSLTRKDKDKEEGRGAMTPIEQHERIKKGKKEKPPAMKIPKGAGVLVEIKNGTDKDYVEMANKCQKTIKLKDLGIPPLGIRRARGEGILMEIIGDESEEKARRWPAE